MCELDRDRTGTADRAWLEKCFHKLMLNFTWWVNRGRGRKQPVRRGFLGLDNITVVDRSRPLGAGRHSLQSDATGWMGMFSLT